MNKLYGSDLATLYQTAPHRGTVEAATFVITTKSPSCSDEITFSGIISDNTIQTIQFTGTGSMLSQIFAELLCQKIEGQSVSSLHNLKESDIKNLIPLDLGPNRLVPLVAMIQTLQEEVCAHA